MVESIYGNSSVAIAHFVPIRDEISTLYREPPIDASYQVSVHLAKRRFLKICIEINAF
jgi:hypothetical protein